MTDSGDTKAPWGRFGPRGWDAAKTIESSGPAGSSGRRGRACTPALLASYLHSSRISYTSSASRTRGHEDESLRTVELEQVTPDGWADYDTVLLGYPIWWGIAAWPTDGFASGNDFSGKTVIPFCTSASSPIGESGSNLAELAGTGDWQEGQRFSSGVADDEVASWAQGLAL